jgi:hypothetical protein
MDYPNGQIKELLKRVDRVSFRCIWILKRVMKCGEVAREACDEYENDNETEFWNGKERTPTAQEEIDAIVDVGNKAC